MNLGQDGALIVENEDKRKTTFYAGEVSLR